MFWKKEYSLNFCPAQTLSYSLLRILRSINYRGKRLITLLFRVSRELIWPDKSCHLHPRLTIWKKIKCKIRIRTRASFFRFERMRKKEFILCGLTGSMKYRWDSRGRPSMIRCEMFNVFSKRSASMLNKSQRTQPYIDVLKILLVLIMIFGWAKRNSWTRSLLRLINAARFSMRSFLTPL